MEFIMRINRMNKSFWYGLIHLNLGFWWCHLVIQIKFKLILIRYREIVWKVDDILFLDFSRIYFILSTIKSLLFKSSNSNCKFFIHSSSSIHSLFFAKENQNHLLPTMFARLELIERIVILLRRTLSLIDIPLIERM
jgi:hypothetical protein